MDIAITWLFIFSTLTVVYYIGYINGKAKIARQYLPIIKEVREAVELADEFRKQLFKENQRLKHENLILKDELNELTIENEILKNEGNVFKGE